MPFIRRMGQGRKKALHGIGGLFDFQARALFVHVYRPGVSLSEKQRLELSHRQYAGRPVILCAEGGRCAGRLPHGHTDGHKAVACVSHVGSADAPPA